MVRFICLVLLSLYSFAANANEAKCGSARYAWENVTKDAPFDPRDGAGLVSKDGFLYLLGGWNAFHKPTTNSEVWRSRDGAKWERLPDAPWEGRHTAGAVVFKDRIWIIGGDGSHGHYQADIWSTADGISWVKEADAPWAKNGRIGFSTFVHDGYIWVLGGQTVDQYIDNPPLRSPIFYSDVWRSADGRKWEKVSDDNPWAPRSLLTAPFVFEGRLQIVGGGTYETGLRKRLYFNDRWSSSDGKTWREESDYEPWGARIYHMTAVFDDRMWVMGGNDGHNISDTWFSCGDGWFKVKTPWKPRHAASVAVHNGSLYLLGGPLDSHSVWRLRRANKAVVQNN